LKTSCIYTEFNGLAFVFVFLLRLMAFCIAHQKLSSRRATTHHALEIARRFGFDLRQSVEDEKQVILVFHTGFRSGVTIRSKSSCYHDPHYSFFPS